MAPSWPIGCEGAHCLCVQDCTDAWAEWTRGSFSTWKIRIFVGVRQAGLHCAVVTDATIVHYGGASYREESVPRIKTMLAPHFLRSKYHYVRQERGRIGECSVRLTDLILGLSGLLRRKESATSRMRIAESLRPGSRSTVRHRMALARSIAHS